MSKNFYSPRSPLVPVFQNVLTNESGEILPIEIVEVLNDKMQVVEWRFLQDDVIKLNGGKTGFLVGELVLDFINKSEEIRKAFSNGEIACDSAMNEVIAKAATDREYLLDLLINNKDNPTAMNNLYINFKEIYETLGNQIQIIPFDCGSFSPDFYGHKYLVYGSLEFSFLFLDFYHVVNNHKISFSKCKHCNHLFVKNKRNQMYCDRCRNENIPEKTRKKSNPSYILRQRIYSRLNKRDMAGNSIEYVSGIKDHFDFSIVARQKWAELSEDQYLKWLEYMDEVTKKPLIK